MKKVFTFFLAMAIIFGISGCGKKEYIVFPFSASDVVKLKRTILTQRQTPRKKR